LDLTLTRFESRADGIFGMLTDAVGQRIAHTLEHAYDDGQGGWTAKIPAGTFTCVRGDHLLDGMTTPFSTFEITGVPGHTGLLFHWGNYNSDSEGCVLLGYSEVDAGGRRMITASRASFARFMQLQAGQDSFQLVVR
jgi:hypothetical protein